MEYLGRKILCLFLHLLLIGVDISECMISKSFFISLQLLLIGVASCRLCVFTDVVDCC